MALQPQFAAVPRVSVGVISVANSNRNGSGAVVDCFTAGPNGSLVRRITIQAIVSTSAGTVRIYVSIGGTTYLYREIAVPAITVSGTVQAFNSSFTLYDANSDGMPLPSGGIIRASTEVANNMNVIVEGGDY
jgi:hypothetical protein